MPLATVYYDDKNTLTNICFLTHLITIPLTMKHTYTDTGSGAKSWPSIEGVSTSFKTDCLAHLLGWLGQNSEQFDKKIRPLAGHIS